jgi:hypothetical protein
MPEDLVQPAAQMADLDPRAHRSERRQERLLNEILGVTARREPARKGQQRAAVALHDRGEGAL